MPVDDRPGVERPVDRDQHRADQQGSERARVAQRLAKPRPALADDEQQQEEGDRPDDAVRDDGEGGDAADGTDSGADSDVLKICFELAGIIGCDPWLYSFRELYWMSRSKQDDEWNHTAFIVAQLANCHRDSKKRKKPYKASEFHPFSKKKKKSKKKRQELGRAFIGSMAAAFCEAKR